MVMNSTAKLIELTDQEGYAQLFNPDYIITVYHDEESDTTCIITTDCKVGAYYEVRDSVKTIQAKINLLSSGI